MLLSEQFLIYSFLFLVSIDYTKMGMQNTKGLPGQDAQLCYYYYIYTIHTFGINKKRKADRILHLSFRICTAILMTSNKKKRHFVLSSPYLNRFQKLWLAISWSTIGSLFTFQKNTFFQKRIIRIFALLFLQSVFFFRHFVWNWQDRAMTANDFSHKRG